MKVPPEMHYLIPYGNLPELPGGRLAMSCYSHDPPDISRNTAWVFFILEVPPAAGPLHTEVWGDSFQLRDGYLLPPTAPGLGVRLTEEVKKKHPFQPGTGEFSSVPGRVMRT